MPKKTLKVSLDLSANADPNVVISDRRLKAKGAKIRWEKDDDNHDFKFKRLNELNQALFNQQSIDLDREKIRCNNRAPEDGTE